MGDGEPKTIARLGFECQRRFAVLREAVASTITGYDDDVTSSAVDDELGRFRIWAKNIGALSVGRASLDYRLRDADYLNNNVKSLLEDLNESLCEATALVNGDGDMLSRDSHNASDSDISISTGSDSAASSAAGSGHETQLDLRRYCDEIVSLVDKLFSVSILIRGTSPNFRASRAAVHVEKDQEGVDLVAEFKSIVVLRITALYPETPTWLVERMANLVAMRRQQFYYQRAHKRRLAKIPTEFQEDDIPTGPAPSKITKAVQGIDNPDGEVAAPKSTRTRTTSKTIETTATELIPENEQPADTPLRGKPTFSEKRIGENIFPPPPRDPVGKDFECNQCFHILPDATRKEAHWREHLLSDLRPYSCMSQYCKDYDQLFDTREKWMEHEFQFHHNEWWCDATHCKNSSSKIFLSEEAFTQHLRMAHVDSFENHQLPFLVARAKRPSLFPFKFCPFCADADLDLTEIKDLYKMTGNDYDHLQTSIQLQKHIGTHLQNFAIFAFLEQDQFNDEQETATADAEKDQRSSSNLSSNSLNSEEKALVLYAKEALPPTQTEPPELDGEFNWDFIGDYTPIRDRIEPKDDPNLENFVTRYRTATLSKGKRLDFIEGKGSVPLGGPNYIGILAKHRLLARDKEDGRNFTHIHINAGNRLERVPQTVDLQNISAQTDQKFLAHIKIGNPPQLLRVQLDTSTADFWVFSTLLEPSSLNNANFSHSLFNPKLSKTWNSQLHESKFPRFLRKQLEWDIEYGDGSSVSGIVGFDDVEIGDIKISNQAVQLVDAFRGKQFLEGELDGILGLGPGILNSVLPSTVKRPLQSIADQNLIPQNLFTINLYPDSYFTFGFIDTAAVDGRSIHWVDVDSQRGFWMFSSQYATVGRKKLNRPNGVAIVDSGSNLILTHPHIVWMIYRHIEGARYDPNQPGWIYPAGVKIPEVSFSVGDDETCLVFIDRHNMDHSEVSPGMIFGAIQENPAYESGDFPHDIFGTPFLRQVYAIFDWERQRFGVVKHESGSHTEEEIDEPSESNVDENIPSEFS